MNYVINIKICEIIRFPIVFVVNVQRHNAMIRTTRTRIQKQLWH